MKLNKVRLLILSSGLCLLPACSGTRTGNPLTSGTGLIVTSSASAVVVAYNDKSWLEKLTNLFFPKALALPPPSSILDSTGANAIELGEYWMVIKEIEFKAAESGGTEQEIALEGPFTVDMLTSTPSSLGAVGIAAGTYKRIKWKMEHEAPLESSAPAGLSGNSIYISGTVTSQGYGSQAFSFSSADGAEFEIGGPNGVVVASSSTLLVTFKIADLLHSIDLSLLAADGSRAISESHRILSLTDTSPCPSFDSSARDLYTCIRNGLAQKTDFGKDVDGDHELDSGDEHVKAD